MSNTELVFTAVGSPALLAVITSVINYFIRRSEKKLDWERQDEVARRVELVQQVVQATNQENTGLLTKMSKTVVGTHEIVNNQRTILLTAYAVALELIASQNPKDKGAQRAAKEARKAATSAEKVQEK